jgi:hypothetical protein
MGFDKNDPKPIINPAKKTTKVNFSIVIGVFVFLAIGFAAMAVFEHFRH